MLLPVAGALAVLTLFELASRSHFFLCIEAYDPKFRQEEAIRFLKDQNPMEVSVVDW